MILRLEVDEIRNVRRRRALCFLRVTQTRAGRTNRFVLSCEPVAVEKLVILVDVAGDYVKVEPFRSLRLAVHEQ